MLFSFALILMAGMGAGWLCKKAKLPPLIGMIATGIVIGPFVLNLIDPTVLAISPYLRKMALVIILTRAGLSLNLDDLKKVGRPAVLMCFLPACFEMAATIIFAPMFLGISTMDAAILGAVLAAVSPAVVVPGMLKLMDTGYGTDKSIPQLILAGASVDDVFVIVMFSAFTGMAQGEGISAMSFVNIPLSIAIGIGAGLGIGFLVCLWFKHYEVRDTVKVLIVLSISFVLTTIEDNFSSFPFASLIAVMCVGIMINRKEGAMAKSMSSKCNQLWIGAETFLFVLVGACVNISYIPNAGLNSVLLIFSILAIRMAGVIVCLIKTQLNRKERVFCMFAYTPKATVQAAIGGVPLAMGLGCGELVLTVAVLAIIITAPLGAILIEATHRKLLNHTEVKETG